MKKFIFIISVLLTTSIILVAQFKKHTVVKGDCLWDIAGYYYNDPFLWPVIYKANEDSIADPHWIYPGEVFVIPDVPEEQATTMPVEEGLVKEIRGTKGELQEESREAMGSMEPEKEGDEILFSVVKAEDYAFTKKAALLAGFITKDANIEIGKVNKKIEPIKELRGSLTTLGDIIEINRGSSDGISVDDIYVIFKWDRRVGRYGKIVRIKGIFRIIKTGEEFSEAQVIESYEIIEKGDHFMQYNPPELLIGKAIPVTLELEGRLIALKDKQDIIKPFSVVYIDLGENSGAQIGDVFLIYKDKGDIIVPLGKIQIVDVREETSSGYITSIMGNTEISLGNKIKLVGRIGG